MAKRRDPLVGGRSFRFKEFVSRAEPTTSFLPLTHVTDAYALRDIVEDGALEPTACPVFREPLLYLFYGRPAFRKNIATQSSRNRAYAPVCLIVHPANELTPRRIFPFDSGAFDAKLMSSFFHNRMRVEDFGLEPDLTSAAQLVKLFFDSNHKYFSNRTAQPPGIPALNFEAQSYAELIQKADEDEVDERLSTVEVQISGSVDLQSHVVAVVLPEPFLEDSELMARLAELNVEPLPFMYVDRWRPIDCTSAVYSAVSDFYRRPNMRLL